MDLAGLHSKATIWYYTLQQMTILKLNYITFIETLNLGKPIHTSY